VSKLTSNKTMMILCNWHREFNWWRSL